MNKENLLNKLAERAAAKATAELTTTTPPQEETPQAHNEPTSQLKSFEILWSEAGDQYDNQQFFTWKEANAAISNLWNRVKQGHTGGYYKTKVMITWMNGKCITDRLDLGTGGDLNPDVSSIGDYLKGARGVMYASNLMNGDRDNLQWEDSEDVTILEDTATKLSESINEIPAMLKQLIGIVDTIEEANDNSDAALIKCSEQVERCEYYITYLQSILPILKSRTNAMIEAKHTKRTTINIDSFNSHLN